VRSTCGLSWWPDDLIGVALVISEAMDQIKLFSKGRARRPLWLSAFQWRSPLEVSVPVEDAVDNLLSERLRALGLAAPQGADRLGGGAVALGALGV
jgi:hypothetical protein